MALAVFAAISQLLPCPNTVMLAIRFMQQLERTNQESVQLDESKNKRKYTLKKKSKPVNFITRVCDTWTVAIKDTGPKR